MYNYFARMFWMWRLRHATKHYDILKATVGYLSHL